MKKFIPILLALATFNVLAQDEEQKEEKKDPKHVISISTDGFGWSGLARAFEWDTDERDVEDDNSSEGKIAVNYSYIFPSRIMLGFEVLSETSRHEFELNNNQIVKTSSESLFGLTLGYNFNIDIYNSWWIKGAVGKGYLTTETDAGPVDVDSESDSTFAQVSLGKRISLDSWGLKYISYNPSISARASKFNGDIEEDGLESQIEGRIDLIKVDVLW